MGYMFFSIRCELNEMVLQPAAMHGHLHVLQWAAAQPELEFTCLKPALCSTHVPVLEWADSLNLPRHVMTAVRAAETGLLPLIRLDSPWLSFFFRWEPAGLHWSS